MRSESIAYRESECGWKTRRLVFLYKFWSSYTIVLPLRSYFVSFGVSGEISSLNNHIKIQSSRLEKDWFLSIQFSCSMMVMGIIKEWSVLRLTLVAASQCTTVSYNWYCCIQVINKVLSIYTIICEVNFCNGTLTLKVRAVNIVYTLNE